MTFSIVMPVYNGKDYLERCVSSVLAQSYRDFELILVDDGSTDGAEQLCDAFAASDARVQVIHRANGGVHSARQQGLEHAQGEYTIFLDSDDWYEPDMLSNACEIIEKTGAELITNDFIFEFDSGSVVLKNPVPPGFYPKEQLKRDIYPSVLQNENNRNLSYAVGKIMKTDLMKEAILGKLMELHQGEDALSSVLMYLKINSVFVSDIPFYHYRNYSSSLSHHFSLKQYDDIETTIHALEDVRQDRIDDYVMQIHRFTDMILFGYFRSAIDNNARDQLGEIKKCMARKTFMDHMKQAKFKGISLKTRLTYFLFRHNWIYTAWYFLSFCRAIKGGT